MRSARIEVHPRVSIDHVCMMRQGPAEFIASCRELGARHIVLSSPHLLTDTGPEQARRALAGTSIEVEAVNAPFAVFPNLQEDRGEATATMLKLIEIGSRLGARSAYFLTGGRARLDWDAAADRFAELVRPCLLAARERGMTLMIENAPALYADIHIAHSLADTLELAERTGVGVCIELYFCWAEAGLERLFRRAMPICGLVQVSDYVLGDRSLPNRAVPGDGAIPLERLLGEVLEAGYEGVFDIELIGPRIDAEGPLAATRRAAERISEILTRLGA
ncbi:MAG TPA: sugar phosphate isomerase/epimerase family protein [Myxococcota bacterium]|nr:sugar phosphate isomerase/epimerase family protein [Myxococcota bacterium]